MTARGGHTETRPRPHSSPRRLTLQTASWITAAVFKILTEGLVFQAGGGGVLRRIVGAVPLRKRHGRAVPSQPLGSRVPTCCHLAHLKTHERLRGMRWGMQRSLYTGRLRDVFK